MPRPGSAAPAASAGACSGSHARTIDVHDEVDPLPLPLIPAKRPKPLTPLLPPKPLNPAEMEAVAVMMMVPIVLAPWTTKIHPSSTSSTTTMP